MERTFSVPPFLLFIQELGSQLIFVVKTPSSVEYLHVNIRRIFGRKHVIFVNDTVVCKYYSEGGGLILSKYHQS